MSLENNKIKILYIHPKLTFGGAEIQRLALLENWNLSRYSVSLLCIEKIGEIGERIQRLGFPVYCLNQSSKPYNLRATFMLFIFLLKHRFDIVQTCLFNANFHGRIAAFLARVHFVFSEEHSEHYQYNSFKFLPYILTDRILSRGTTKIICCCKTLQDDIAKLESISPDKFVTILSTVNLEELKVTVSRAELRKNLKFADSDLVIGNVSGMSPRKGHEYLLRAFSQVKKKIPNSRIIFIGQEDNLVKKTLEGLADKLNIINSIYFLGKVKECASYYNIMDLFALSSLHEGIPLVILEAIQAGVPVISTDVGGVSEIITHNETGILVPPRDVNALSDSMVELLLDKEKRSRLSRAAKERALSRFKPDRYLKELDNVYSEALD